MQLNLIGQRSDGLISLSNVVIIDVLTGKSNDEIWELWKKRKSATTKLQEDLDKWFQSQPWSELDRRFTKDFNFMVDRAEEAKDWIPAVIQLDGSTEQEKYLAERINGVDGINDKIQASKNYTQTEKSQLKWDQSKVDAVWKACEEFNDKYDVQVDLRLLLAITIKEGTGSYNTSSSNLAADGQHGVQTDFKVDLSNAVDVLGGKIVSYSYYREDFSKARDEAYKNNLKGIKDYDDILHYLNWKTPRLQIDSKKFDSGVYAGDSTWHRGIRDIYSKLSYEDAPKDYTEYVGSFDKDKIFEVAD